MCTFSQALLYSCNIHARIFCNLHFFDAAFFSLSVSNNIETRRFHLFTKSVHRIFFVHYQKKKKKEFNFLRNSPVLWHRIIVQQISTTFGLVVNSRIGDTYAISNPRYGRAYFSYIYFFSSSWPYKLWNVQALYELSISIVRSTNGTNSYTCVISRRALSRFNFCIGKRRIVDRKKKSHRTYRE